MEQEVPTLFTPLDYSPVEAKAQREALRKERENKQADLREQYFNDFLNEKSDKADLYTFINPRGIYGQKILKRQQVLNDQPIDQDVYDNDRLLTNTTKNFQDRMQNESIDRLGRWNEWNDYLTEKLKKRYADTDPDFKQLEISRDPSVTPLSVMMKGFNDKLSLGLIDTRHPIYDNDAQAVYSNYYQWGGTLGDIVAFMSLAKVAGATGLMAKLGKTTRPILSKVIKTLGIPTAVASKFNKVVIANEMLDDVLAGAQRLFLGEKLAVPMLKATPQLLGAQGAIVGGIGSFMSGVESAAKHFREEDKMSTSQWLKSLPKSLLEGFFYKYFAHVINAPASWPMRFLGDSVYSAADQVYQYASGKIDRIDPQAYFRSFLQGHFLGEVQGKVFSPGKKEIAKMETSKGINRVAEEIIKQNPNYDKKSIWWDANVLWSAELKNVENTGKRWTDEELSKIVEATPISTREGYTIKNAIDHPEMVDISLKDAEKFVTDKVQKERMDTLRRNWNITEKEAEDLYTQHPDIFNNLKKYSDLNIQYNKKESLIFNRLINDIKGIDSKIAQIRVRTDLDDISKEKMIAIVENERINKVMYAALNAVPETDFIRFHEELARTLGDAFDVARGPWLKQIVSDVTKIEGDPVYRNDEAIAEKADPSIKLPDEITREEIGVARKRYDAMSADEKVVADQKITKAKAYWAQLFSPADTRYFYKFIRQKLAPGSNVRIEDAEDIMQNMAVKQAAYEKRYGKYIWMWDDPQAMAKTLAQREFDTFLSEQFRELTGILGYGMSDKAKYKMIQDIKSGKITAPLRPQSIDDVDTSGRPLSEKIADTRRPSDNEAVRLEDRSLYTIYLDYIETAKTQAIRDKRAVDIFELVLNDVYHVSREQRMEILKRIDQKEGNQPELDKIMDQTPDAIKSKLKRIRYDLRQYIFRLGLQIGRDRIDAENIGQRRTIFKADPTRYEGFNRKALGVFSSDIDRIMVKPISNSDLVALHEIMHREVSKLPEEKRNAFLKKTMDLYLLQRPAHVNIFFPREKRSGVDEGELIADLAYSYIFYKKGYARADSEIPENKDKITGIPYLLNIKDKKVRASLADTEKELMAKYPGSIAPGDFLKNYNMAKKRFDTFFAKPENREFAKFLKDVGRKQFNDLYQREIAGPGTKLPSMGPEAAALQAQRESTAADIRVKSASGFDQLNRKASEIDPRNGLPRAENIFTAKATGNDGVYILSVKDIINELKEKYGEDTGRKVEFKVAQILDKEVDDINSALMKANNGNLVQRLYLRSTAEGKIGIMAEGIDGKEFARLANYLKQILVNNYSDVIDPGKRFAIIVNDPTGKPYAITRFKNVNLSFFNNLRTAPQQVEGAPGEFDFSTIAKTAAYLDNKSRDFDNAVKIASVLNTELYHHLLNSTYSSQNREANVLINQIKKVMSGKDNLTFDEAYSRLVDKQIADPAKIKQLNILLYELANIADSLPSQLPGFKHVEVLEKMGNEKLDPKTAGQIAGETSYLDSTDFWHTAMGKFILGNIDDPISKIMAGAPKVFDRDTKPGFFKDLYFMITDKLTDFNNKERDVRNIPSIQAIYKLADNYRKGDLATADLLEFIYQDFKYPNYSEKQMDAYNRALNWMIETEMKNLPRAGVNELRRPIEWKNDTVKDEAMLERWAQNPEMITPKEIVKFRESIKDKNVQPALHKFLVQYMNFKPEDLVAVMGRLQKYWFDMVGKDFENVYDKNNTMFHRLKDKWGNAFLQTLYKNANIKLDVNDKSKIQGAFDIRKIDLTKYDKREIMQFIMQIENPTMRRLATEQYRYYTSADPANLSWMHHSVLAKHNNQVRLFSQLNDLLSNKLPSGKGVLDPVLRGFTGRQLPTLDDLVKAGYTVDNNGLGGLKASMVYYTSRKINEKMAELFKSQFLGDFKGVYDRAISDNNPELMLDFFKEGVGGYFYKPTSYEIGIVKNRMKDITAQIKALQQSGGPESESKIVELGSQRAALEEKFNTMNNLVSIYTGRTQFFKNIADKQERATANQEFMKNVAKYIAAGDVYLPANVTAFNKDTVSGSDIINSIIKEKDQGVNGENLEGFEGLYFNRNVWKGMKQYVFRDDYLNKNYNYNAAKTIMNAYDKANTFLKLIRFYKPTIVLWNNIAQSSLVDLTYFNNFPFAYRAQTNPRAKDANGNLTEEAEFYNRMAENNLFNQSVSFEPVVRESSNIALEMLGRAGLGREIMDRVGEAGGLGKIAELAKGSWKGMQAVTWGIDDLFRLATAKPIYDRFLKMYDKDRAAFLAAEWTNLFMSKYSRMPTKTRQFLNRLAFVPTYRIQMLRMYKEMLRMSGQGILRLAGVNQNSRILNNPFKVSENRVEQALFEIAPMVRWMGTSAAVKALAVLLLGFGFDNAWDTITSYRTKKSSGGLLDKELEFMSFSSPLFDLNKIITRPLEVTLKYNIAAFPGLLWSLGSNSNAITGKPIITADMKRQPGKALAQLGLDIVGTYFPFGQDLPNLFDKDIDLVYRLLNFSGASYYYKFDNQKELLADFKVAFDKSQSMAERQQAYDEFYKKFQRAYKTVFKNDYKPIIEYMDDLRKQQEDKSWEE